jgi:hypothetical protein
MLAPSPGGSVDFSVIQWVIGLGLSLGIGASGLFVARALHGRALSQLEEWRTNFTALMLPSRVKVLETASTELKDADVLGQLKDLQREIAEIKKWQGPAKEQLEQIERDREVEARVEEALAKESGASTSRGTIPYPKAGR